MKVEDLKKYKDGLYGSLSRDLEAFEKNFLLIATGVLAFSVSFIKDIVKIEGAVYLFLLFLGWLLILVAVGLMMYAFLSSVSGSNKLWKIVDDYLLSNKKFEPDQVLTEEESTYIKTQTNNTFYETKDNLKYLRFSAIWSFLIGFFLFATFVSLNLYKENEKDKSIKIVNEQKTMLQITTGKTKITTNDSTIVVTPY